ncbi:hypothetical protein DMUE_5023 [Dictyocoela muelleri]|nr:hypothetical protein DMUE_5023 [Dictyocoela muelleri]
MVYTRNTDGILVYILRKKYNSSQAQHYYQKLANIRERNICTIQAYASAINDNCKKFALCSNWSVELFKQKTEEPFFMNLENHVKIEMQKIIKNTPEEILATIDKIKIMLVE